MKNKILIGFFLIICSGSSFSQNKIKYKLACDRAYSFFEKKDYQTFIIEIEKVEKKYQLSGEELVHKSIAYGRLNQKQNAIDAMAKSWQTLNIDMSFRLYDMFKIDSLLNFSKEDWSEVKERNKKVAFSRGVRNSDSIKIVLSKRMDMDQLIRELYFSEPDSLKRCDVLVKMKIEDSISQTILSEFILTIGFPGDSICPNNQAIAELILFHATNKVFFERHNKVLLNQIKKGLISPYAYAYWYDRCMMEQSLPPKYFNYYFLPKISTKDIIKNRMKIGMSMYYEIENSYYN